MSNICVVGLGYIGLPTAAVLALRGHKVLGVDVSIDVVESLRAGQVHIVEPDLDVAVTAAINSNALRVSTEVEPSEVFVIAVPTPFSDGHKPDLSYVRSAAEMLAPSLRPGALVILESTSPVGATQQLCGWLSELRPDLKTPDQHPDKPDIHVAHCPERVLPGRVLTELVDNDRVIGGISPVCTEAAITLYETFVQGECIGTNASTAEMAKLTENAYRDVNIAFANELSVLAEEQDVNVWELIKLANRHPRVNILQPGPGVGGHCIAVDPWFLVDASPENARLIRQAREVNDGKPGWVLDKVRKAVRGIEAPKIACLGLAFKPNIDDLRESPSLDICMDLAALTGSQVLAVEPHIATLPDHLLALGNVALKAPAEAVEQADVVLLLVDHKVFKDIPKQCTLEGKTVIDTRGQWQGLPH